MFDLSEASYQKEFYGQGNFFNNSYSWNQEFEIEDNNNVQCIQMVRINNRIRAFGIKTKKDYDFFWIGDQENLTVNEKRLERRRNFCFGKNGNVTKVMGVKRLGMLDNMGFCFYSPTLHSSRGDDDDKYEDFMRECNKMDCNNFKD